MKILTVLEFYDVILQNVIAGPSNIVCTDASGLYDYPFNFLYLSLLHRGSFYYTLVFDQCQLLKKEVEAIYLPKCSINFSYHTFDMLKFRHI